MATTIQETATPKDGSGNALVNRVITWASDNTAVATVTNTGLVSAVAVGTCHVTASCEGINSAAVLITVVNANTVSSIALTPTAASVQIGATLQLAATPEDANGNPISATITWTSDTPSVATVDASGVVTGVASGSATITAAVGSVQATCAITVPSNTTTRQLWWAADSLTSDVDGQLVGSWPDLAASPTVTMTQATSAAKPSFQTNVINGKPVVEFAAGDYLIYTGQDAVAWTRFFVINATSLSALGFLLFGPAAQISVGTDGSVSLAIIWVAPGGAATYKTGAGVVVANTPVILEVAWDGSASTNVPTLLANGTAHTMTLVSGSATGKTRKSEAGTTYVGGQTNTNTFVGDIPELVKIADAAVHVDERDRLGTKYGISVI